MLPEIKFFGILIPTYFGFLSALYCVLLILVVKKTEKENSLNPTQVLNACFWIMVPAFVGARILHVLWESPEIYYQDWHRIFKIWNGGFVYFGGFLAGVLGLWGYTKYNKENFWVFADFFVPVAAFGYGVGRIACFLAGCCYGAYCDFAWAPGGRNPVQLYSTVLEVINGYILWKLSQRSSFSSKPGMISAVFLVSHGMIRFGLEFLRADFRGNTLLGLSISSWISLGLIFWGGFLLRHFSRENKLENVRFM